MRTCYALACCTTAALLMIPETSSLSAPILGKAPQSVQEQYVSEPPGVSVATWVSGLIIPWSLVFLSDGRALVSERRGQIRMIDGNGQLAPKPYATLQVAANGEGGLMGLTLHPQFQQQPYLYAMLTRLERGGMANAVIRLKHLGDHAEFDRDIVKGSRPAPSMTAAASLSVLTACSTSAPAIPPIPSSPRTCIR